MVQSHNKGSELYEAQKSNIKFKIIVILMALGVLFALFDALLAT